MNALFKLVLFNVIGIIIPALMCSNDAFSQINNHAKKFEHSSRKLPFSNYLKSDIRVESPLSLDVYTSPRWDYSYSFKFGERADITRDVVGPDHDFYHTSDEMPCLKPEGYFPMQVIRPDNTVWHTLLIK